MNLLWKPYQRLTEGIVLKIMCVCVCVILFLPQPPSIEHSSGALAIRDTMVIWLNEACNSSKLMCCLLLLLRCCTLLIMMILCDYFQWECVRIVSEKKRATFVYIWAYYDPSLVWKAFRHLGIMWICCVFHNFFSSLHIELLFTFDKLNAHNIDEMFFLLPSNAPE